MKVLLLRKGKGEEGGDKRKETGGKGRDLPDQVILLHTPHA